MLRRSPTTVGVLLSFSFFAGLLTLLLLAQRTIPGRGTETLEPLPSEVVGPSILEPAEEPTEEPSRRAGSDVSQQPVVAVPGGPAVIAPVSGLGPSGQVNEPVANPDNKKPGDQGKGKEPKPPVGGEQPSPPVVGQPAPSPPGGESPSVQPTPPPAILPSALEVDDDDGSDEDEGEDDDDDTDTDDEDDRANDAEGGDKSGKGGGKDDD